MDIAIYAYYRAINVVNLMLNLLFLKPITFSFHIDLIYEIWVMTTILEHHINLLPYRYILF